MSSQSEQALVEGPCEEGVQKVLMDQSQAQDTTAEPEPDPKHRKHGKNQNPSQTTRYPTDDSHNGRVR